jgi:DNA-binding NtrC family response regulator
LLRVLEDGSLRRVGSLKERRVNVRLVASTNRDMAKEVQTGRFREDLFYRINVMSLELPPLRRRTGDIPVLTAHFLGPDWGIEDEALATLRRYDWPGNVRQLINAIERAKILADEPVVRARDLPSEITSGPGPPRRPALPESDDLAALERAKIVEVLRRENGNKTRAARVLGIDRRKLYRLLEKHRIDECELRGAQA